MPTSAFASTALKVEVGAMEEGAVASRGALEVEGLAKVQSPGTMILDAAEYPAYAGKGLDASLESIPPPTMLGKVSMRILPCRIC